MKKRGQLGQREGTWGRRGYPGVVGPATGPTCPPPSSPHGRPRATSGHVAASPRPRRRSPTCHWRPPSRTSQLREVQRPGQGSGQTCAPALPAPTEAPRVPGKPISSQLSPATLALGARSKASATCPPSESNTVSRASAGPASLPGDGRTACVAFPPSPPSLFSARASLVLESWQARSEHPGSAHL